MSERRCLNCGATLHGGFCGECGQRAVPPNPTVRELAGDAWQELSGYDGRIMHTIRGLARPGFLTREYVEGRRAHYLPPLRVYLIVSVIYFVIAASAPEGVGSRGSGTVSGPRGMRVDIGRASDGAALSEPDRAELLRSIESAPWFLRPIVRAVAEDPGAFRARLFTVMPRVFFALLPVFAGVVALFYRRCHFPTALVFAVHLHAFAFVVFAIGEAAKFSGNALVADLVSGILTVLFAVYALRSFRAVFGGSWPVSIAKAAGIGMVYLVATIPAFLVMVVWASLS